MSVTELRWATTPNGTKLAYERRVAADGPPLLALHGILVGTSNWIHQVLRLPRLRWLLPHLRGHGMSPPPMPRQTIEEAALDVLSVLDAEQVEQAVVLGNSLGATIALAFALMRLQRVHALVLVEPSLPALAGEDERERLRRSAELTRSLLAAGKVDDALAHFLVPRLGEDWMQKAGQRRLEEWRRNVFSAPTWIDAVLAFDPGPVPLAALNRPTLLVYGANTQRAYRRTVFALSELLPQAEIAEIPHAGHGAPVDNPEAFNARLLDFLGRVNWLPNQH
ncbi:alpha/beta hydrolase [Thermomicrobium sp. CFH 73360]|uniref:alpha/beta fold hydrolase n=1 Tax=Thermomicrobium sp. CFH 73360 TaxID=2951987 RepID=UPI002076F541|nr:alpha/beta hydrolase [Thermomicrobium sp. CFH 73360]